MDKINVLVDYRWNGGTGIGRLLNEVISRKPDDVDTQFITGKYQLGHPFSPLYLKNQIEHSDAQVFYSPAFMPPLLSSKPFVITIHDLNHLYYYSQFHKFYMKYVIGKLAKQAKAIITVSEYTKHLLIDQLKIKESIIKVIYNGVAPIYFSNQDKHQNDRPYFLYIGNRRSYKNIHRMLRAFANAKISNDYCFLMSGFMDNDMRELINNIGIGNRVKFLGNINESELPHIYRGAFALMFVSLMEGFGLPLIEAMACGTPTITSNVSSLPEIAGGAAILVNPLSTHEITSAIETLVTDRMLYRELVSLGEYRAKNFCWETTASKTWKVILQ